MLLTCSSADMVVNGGAKRAASAPKPIYSFSMSSLTFTRYLMSSTADKRAKMAAYRAALDAQVRETKAALRGAGISPDKKGTGSSPSSTQSPHQPGAKSEADGNGTARRSAAGPGASAERETGWFPFDGGGTSTPQNTAKKKARPERSP